MQRFVAIIERTLEHVVARQLVTARFSLTPTTVLRVLDGVPAEHLRSTVSAVARVQIHLAEGREDLEEAEVELAALRDFWINASRG